MAEPMEYGEKTMLPEVATSCFNRSSPEALKEAISETLSPSSEKAAVDANTESNSASIACVSRPRVICLRLKLLSVLISCWPKIFNANGMR
jgi:hypothetical protein